MGCHQSQYEQDDLDGIYDLHKSLGRNMANNTKYYIFKKTCKYMLRGKI